MVRIVIADDHELIREGIKKIIRSSKELRIVGECGEIELLLLLTEQHKPDLVILDISLPDYDELQGLEKFRQHFPNIPVILLSMYPEERYAVRAIKLGASGYVTKAMAAEELINAIKKIIGGTSYISPRLAELLAEELGNRSPCSSPSVLSRRELDIAKLLGRGMQLKQIAATLKISVSSVNTYRIRIFKKLGIRSNAALIRYAIEQALLD